MKIILNGIRWIIAATMWIMGLLTLTLGWHGMIAAILFVIVGVLISPLSTKYIFPKMPNLKNSHKIISIAGIWLAANISLVLSHAATTSNTADEAMSTASVSEASVESAEKSIADVSTVEVSEEDIVVAEASIEAATEESSNNSIEETSEESTDKKSAPSSTATTANTTKPTSVASTGSTTESATTEATVDTSAEESGAAQEAAEESAAQQKAEEAAQQAEAEAAAAQQPDSSTVANGTENANALAVLQMGPTTGDVCWVPRKGGTKYHTSPTCSGMDDPICTTVDTAEACEFEACKRCH